MLFTGREVRIGKNCALGLGPYSRSWAQVFPIRTSRQVNNIYVFLATQDLKNTARISKGTQKLMKLDGVYGKKVQFDLRKFRTFRTKNNLQSSRSDFARVRVIANVQNSITCFLQIWSSNKILIRTLQTLLLLLLLF